MVALRLGSVLGRPNPEGVADRMPSNFVAKGANGYEAVMGRWSRRLAVSFLDFSGVPPGGRVLDAGCGTGSLTLALAAHPDLAAIEALDFERTSWPLCASARPIPE
jgi:2-polyprenyl-3-methyl-5-hydroxy-6-metoxy-1,4-benzoquinol methylase